MLTNTRAAILRARERDAGKAAWSLVVEAPSSRRVGSAPRRKSRAARARCPICPQNAWSDQRSRSTRTMKHACHNCLTVTKWPHWSCRHRKLRTEIKQGRKNHKDITWERQCVLYYSLPNREESGTDYCISRIAELIVLCGYLHDRIANNRGKTERENNDNSNSFLFPL